MDCLENNDVIVEIQIALLKHFGHDNKSFIVTRQAIIAT